jgi:hypothetical protein
MPFPRAHLVSAIVAASLVMAPVAHADRNVEIKADRPGVTAAIRALGGDGETIATCSVPCTLNVPDGRYRIEVESDGPTRRRALNVDRDLKIDVRVGSTSASTGRVLGITGTAVAGTALLASILVGGACFGGTCSDADWANIRRDRYIGFGVAGVSAAVAVSAWVLYFTNRTSFRIAGSPAVLVAMPRPGGLTAGFAASF